jgi:predicted ATPase/DNA-binding XRE family transcriptional regulator
LDNSAHNAEVHVDDQTVLSLGLWVKRRRRALDLTQEALAALVGCSKDLIVKIEGDARHPSRAIAGRLADRLQLAPEERDAFIRCARAQLPPDQLPPPTASIARPRLMPAGDAPAADQTFLLAAIDGAGGLWDRHPAAMRLARARHGALLRAAIADAGGSVFATFGDVIGATFQAPLQGLRASLAAQRALLAEPWEACGLPAPIRAQLALHVGAAEPQGGGYAGPTLSRAERILAAAHGGQVLLSAAAQELLRDQLPAGVALRELGSYRLQGLRHPERIAQLLAPGLPSEFPPPRALDALAGNLPPAHGHLIGRGSDIAALLALLRDANVRLLTLTGAGGIGKTRLALAAAAELVDAYPDGVWLVDLAPLIDPAAVPSAIAHTLGLPEIGDQDRLATLKAALRARRALLVLDNCEQVAAAAPAIAELAAACPNLKLLATSRVAMHLTIEHEYPVSPLAAPDPAEPGDLARLAEYDAVRLFSARAQAVRPDFRITDANIRAVAEICARLDGLPLAIELAAARVRLFSPEALLLRLEQDGGLTMLAGGPRDHPERQQTIRATIGWSERLLTPSERALLHQLAIFVGGWPLSAALAVGTADGAAEQAVLGELEALVDHNLVVLRGDAGGEPRYGMLELVRAYALERLRAAGAEQAARRQHADAIVRWAAARDAAFGDKAALAQIGHERANINAALEWSFEAGGADAIYALRIIARVWEYWSLCLQSEGCAWLRRALAIAAQHAAEPATAHVLNAAGRMLWLAGELADPEPLLRRGLEQARRDGDLALEAELLRHLGEYLFAVPGRLAEAQRCFEVGLEIGRACHDALTELWNPVVLGVVALRMGRLDEAMARLAPALSYAEARDELIGQMVALRYMTEVAERQGRAPEAEAYMARAAQFARMLDQGFGVEFTTIGCYLAYLRHEYDDCLAQLRLARVRAQQYSQSYQLFVLASFEATVQLMRGDLALAAGAVRQALALHRREPVYLARAATVAARIATLRRHYAEAASLLGGIARLDQMVIVYLDDQPDPALERWRAEDAAACRAALGATAFRRAWSTGQHGALEDAIAGALDAANEPAPAELQSLEAQ